MNAPQNNQVAAYEPEVIDLPQASTTTANLILSSDAMSSAVAFADIMASGVSTVPTHLRKNRGDCLAITLQAMQWGMNPFAVAQKTHVVSGTLGYEAQLVNAVITARAPVTGRMNYEWFGEWDRIAGKFKEVPAKNNPDEKRIVRDWTLKEEEGLGIKVWATFKGETAPRELRLLLSQAGVRNSPLWGQDPKQQLAYLAVKRWSRLYCPDVILGVYTPDELEERAPSAKIQAEVQKPQPSAELYKEGHTAALKGLSAYQKFWKDTGADNRKLLASNHEEFKQIAEEVDDAKKAAQAAKAPSAKPSETVAADTPTADAAPAVDSVLVYQSLQAAFEAKDLDELQTAADMIGSVADPKQRSALTDEFTALKAALEKEA